MARVTQMKKYVLDTSVIVKWFSENEDNAEYANKLRRQILEGSCGIIIPDLLFVDYDLTQVKLTVFRPLFFEQIDAAIPRATHGNISDFFNDKIFRFNLYL